jgi:hypothetical protein
MTRNGALNLFAVGRSLGLAFAVTGLILVVGYLVYLVAASTLHALPTLTMVAMLGVAGLGLLITGTVLALVCSLTGLLVSRTRFRSD